VELVRIARRRVRGVVDRGLGAAPRQRQRLLGRGEPRLGLLLRGAGDGRDIDIGELARGVHVRHLAFVGGRRRGEQQQEEQGDERDAAHEDCIGSATTPLKRQTEIQTFSPSAPGHEPARCPSGAPGP
jgi:hypothetical protein